MKKYLLPLLLLLSLQANAEVVDRIIALVGNDLITLSDVKHYSSKNTLTEKYKLPNLKDPLESLIREKIFKSEMDRLGVYASDQDIQEAIKDVLKRNQITEDVLKSELSKKGTSYDQYKKNLGEHLTQMKFLGQVIFPRVKISDEEINHKVKGEASDENRYKARMQILEEKAPEEIAKYLEEARAKTYVEIKK